MSIKGKAESYIKLRGSLSMPDMIVGKSAYEVAVASGFEGTEEEWLASLKGEKGDTGEKGVDGTVAFDELTDAQRASLKGEKGDKGDPGEKGADGTMTFEELTEAQKATLKGDKGEKGDKGDTGERGEKGDKGDTGETGAKGEKGDSYVLTDSDKADISGLVLAALPTWEGGSY